MKAQRSSPDPRRGSITVVVLVCLVVITLICSARLLRVSLAERKVVRSEEDRLQAEWLVQAGLERGAARLKADAGYTGETWKLSAEDLGGPDPGLVTIVVETSEGHDDQRALSARADYPAGSSHAVRQSKHCLRDGVRMQNRRRTPEARHEPPRVHAGRAAGGRRDHRHPLRRALARRDALREKPPGARDAS